MEKLVSLCKRRGFIFPSSEIYGGLNGCWDYGPLGVELKRNIKDAWWETIVRQRDDMVGLDCSIIMNPKVWEASGHVSNFNDPMADCKQCKGRFRADQVYTVIARDGDNVLLATSVESDQPDSVKDTATAAANSKTRRRLEERGNRVEWVMFRADQAPDGQQARCPSCGGELTEARKFNMMFKTYVGAMEDSSALTYLRPETAQGIFANFKNVLDTSRMKLPFGIAQIGKSFRNEINPRNFTFRSREFEQMEIEFFCHPDHAQQWYTYWRDARFQWYIDLGLRSERLRLREHDRAELAHYAAGCADIEYAFPFGIAELEGVANRTDFDLRRHGQFSGRDLSYFDEETKERFIPYVIEPSAGADRAALAFLCEAYCEDEAPDENGVPQKRVVMKFHPRLAPVKVAVFPLVKKDDMPEKAMNICAACKKANLASFYDEKGAVGRRYRRQDEIGTPYCITVDGQTLADHTVTVRDRDSLVQERIGIDQVVRCIQDKLAGGVLTRPEAG
ncbi:MAG: glycine--tRNA ligase [Planctomycetes bacterium]|nr:glycine--tRNA ligase [Planctomycetota bacterium]